MADDRTPVLIGAGQWVSRELPPGLERGEAPTPMDVIAEGARRALDDAHAHSDLAAAIDTLVTLRIIPDSVTRHPHDFGRAANPPGSIARRLGARPARAIYGELGGNTPQMYVNQWAQAIARGEADCVLLCGGEAMLTLKQARRRGVRLNWQEEAEGPLEDRGLGARLQTPYDIVHGLRMPLAIYPLFETAIRARRGHGVAEHLRSMGRLFAPFSAVAARNPYAAAPVAHSAEELAEPAGRNRYLVFPYPRLLNARDAVDQAAAVVLTSVARARALGVPAERWVYLHGCADVNEKLLVMDRSDYALSPSMGVLGERALEMAGISIDQVEHIDLYSCFPSAVEVACAALGLREDDSRGLTMTGGLPFFGGPGNNYSMHAIAEAVARCRARPESYAWVSANGGYLSKQSAGVYAARPPARPFVRPDPRVDQERVDRLPAPPTAGKPEGAATVETCAVVMGEDGAPQLGIVIGRTPGGARFAANAEGPSSLAGLMSDGAVGLRGRVWQDGERNRFELN